MGKESGFAVLGKALEPFHKISVVLIALSAVSLHAFISQLLEPLLHVIDAVKLTFPLTIGLLILFLVAYNTNWKNLSFIYIIMSPIPVALLFMALTSISNKYGLEQEGKEEQREKAIEHNEATRRKAVGLKYFLDNTSTYPATGTGVPSFLDKWKHDDSVAKALQIQQAQHPAWYTKNPTTKAIAGSVITIKEMFAIMYHNYGPKRFITGIILALLLAWYIQKDGIDRFKRKENKPPLNELITPRQ